MISRRMLIVAALFCAPLPAFAQSTGPTANNPLAIVNGIYKQVTKGKGDGGFMTGSSAAKAKYFSKSLVALWAKADARTPKDEVGPIDFDPATNSQDPLVKSATAKVEKQDSGTATVTVTLDRGNLGSDAKPIDNLLSYDFVRDGGHWKIDDIRGASGGQPWSIRRMLSDSLKR